jgi:hypothetical protein
MFVTVCSLLGIQKRRTTPYHPQTNGLVERMHRTLKSILRTKIEHYTDWESFLPLVELALHTAVNDHGVSPAMVMFGEQPPMPYALFQQPIPSDCVDTEGRAFVFKLSHNLRMMRKLLLKVDKTVAPYEDPYLGTKITFDMVYVQSAIKQNGLSPMYVGPAVVLSSHGKVLTIRYPSGRIEKVNIERVRPVHKLRLDVDQRDIPAPSHQFHGVTPYGDLATHSDVDVYSDDSMSIIVPDNEEPALKLPDPLMRALSRRRPIPLPITGLGKEMGLITNPQEVAADPSLAPPAPPPVLREQEVGVADIEPRHAPDAGRPVRPDRTRKAPTNDDYLYERKNK